MVVEEEIRLSKFRNVRRLRPTDKISDALGRPEDILDASKPISGAGDELIVTVRYRDGTEKDIVTDDFKKAWDIHNAIKEMNKEREEIDLQMQEETEKSRRFWQEQREARERISKEHDELVEREKFYGDIRERRDEAIGTILKEIDKLEELRSSITKPSVTEPLPKEIGRGSVLHPSIREEEYVRPQRRPTESLSPEAQELLKPVSREEMPLLPKSISPEVMKKRLLGLPPEMGPLLKIGTGEKLRGVPWTTPEGDSVIKPFCPVCGKLMNYIGKTKIGHYRWSCDHKG